MTCIGHYDERWKAARVLRELKLAGDTRSFLISEGPLGVSLHATGAVDMTFTDRESWPLETGAQRPHDGDAA